MGGMGSEEREEWGARSGERGAERRRWGSLRASPSPIFRIGELGSGVLRKADSGGEGAENWGSSAADGLELSLRTAVRVWAGKK